MTNFKIPTESNDVDNNLADVVTVGTWVLANPDFVERIQSGAPLNEPDKNTLYAGRKRRLYRLSILKIINLFS